MTPWKLIVMAVVLVLPGGSLILVAMAAARALKALRAKKEVLAGVPAAAGLGPVALAGQGKA